MDRFDAIELFGVVVETGSFSEAGRRYGHAPSAVTRRIDELERWIGASLFHRSTRRLTLTEAGRAFHARAADILADLEEARVTSAGLDQIPTGVLRVTAASSLGPQLTPAILDFEGRWPDVTVVASFTDQVVDIVSGGVDLAIRLGRLRDSSLKARLLGRGRRSVCASPGYVEQHGAPASPAELAERACLIVRAGPGRNVWRFRAGRKRFEVRVGGRFVCDDGRLLVEAATMGGGIVLAPQWLLGDALRAKRLVPILPEFTPDPPDTPVYAVHAHKKFVPPKVRAFTDFLAARFGHDENWVPARSRPGS